jgi:hypothetical protein
MSGSWIPLHREDDPWDIQVVMCATVIAEVKPCIPIQEEPLLQMTLFGTFR